jgi:hypothetical protein
MFHRTVMPRDYPQRPVFEARIFILTALSRTRKALDLAEAAATLMETGGDNRIVVDRSTGFNKYMVAPRPGDVLAYSSSTANDISPTAFAEVQRRLARLAPDLVLSAESYAEALDGLRDRMRTALRLPSSTRIIFAASGTDLEYIGLAVAHREGSAGIDNILLGAEEVGSGCGHAAQAHFFADRTALGVPVKPGSAVDSSGKTNVRLINVPVRGPGGTVTPSEDMLLEIAAAAASAIADNRHPLVHIVHGSKTGLILPSFAHIDALRRRFGQQLSFVVDACQCRLGDAAIAAYLARGATVFLTGSKFMGGPPFSGMALVPETTAAASAGLLPGFEQIFNRAEWPDSWSNVDRLPVGSNPGLLLRLEASIYELELFQRLTAADIRRTLDLFDESVDVLTRRLGASRVLPYATGEWQEARSHPLEMRTLVTIDLSQTSDPIDFDRAAVLHRMLFQPLGRAGTNREDREIAERRIRLGQPVRCVPLPGGGWGGTLRLGLSMPQMVEFAAMDTMSLCTRLHDDMVAIATKIDIIRDL